MTKQKKIFIPTENANSWKNFLADKDKQWKEGYSAKSTADSWEKGNDIPLEIKNVLCKNPDFKKLELLIAIPEYKVSLPGGSRSSQNDVFAVFTTKNSLSVMTIEGKSKEDFDKSIKEWKSKTSENGIKKRLGFILEKIGLKSENIEDKRYQLFHRLASAVIMAEKFHAKNAIMVIQSFNNNDTENHFDDFVNFVGLYNHSSVEKSMLYKLTNINDINVYASWVYSQI